MGNFNRDNRFSRGSDRGGGRDFSRRDFGRPEMHKAVCNKCGKDCEVPFRPTGSKPIFCRDCFKSNDNFDSNRDGRNFGRPSFDNRSGDRGRTEQPQYREQFESLNVKIEKILKILTPVENTEPIEEAAALKKKTKKSKPATE